MSNITEMSSYEKIKDVTEGLEMFMRNSKLSNDTNKELKKIQRLYLRVAKIAHAVDSLQTKECTEAEFLERIKE